MSFITNQNEAPSASHPRQGPIAMRRNSRVIPRLLLPLFASGCIPFVDPPAARLEIIDLNKNERVVDITQNSAPPSEVIGVYWNRVIIRAMGVHLPRGLGTTTITLRPEDTYYQCTVSGIQIPLSPEMRQMMTREFRSEPTPPTVGIQFVEADMQEFIRLLSVACYPGSYQGSIAVQVRVENVVGLTTTLPIVRILVVGTPPSDSFWGPR